MNDSLSVGNSYTYKQMCECLNEPYKGGTAKQAHIKQICLRYSLTKEGTKYTVLEKYQTPKPKEKRKTTSNFNRLFFKILVLSVQNPQTTFFGSNIKDCGDYYHFEITHTDLYNILGFTKHFHSQYDYPELSKLYENELYAKCSDKIRYALKSLASYHLLRYQNSFLLHYPEYNYEVADSYMLEEIKEAQEKAMNMNDFSTLRAVYAHKKQRDVHNDTLSILQDNLQTRIEDFYALWQITIDKETIKSNLFSEEIKESNLQDCRNELNDLFVKSLKYRGEKISQQLYRFPDFWKAIDPESYQECIESKYGSYFDPQLDTVEVPNAVSEKLLSTWNALIDPKFIYKNQGVKI